MGVAFILVGIAAIVIGILGKEFYVADILSLSGFRREQRSSTWSGRLVFLVVGAGFVALGAKFLMSGK
jgi:NhaP-type Na+/H+ or K+/H+ antiporter